MRQIGTLPSTANPQPLGDYLRARGVTTRTLESPDGWAIWVHNEDHLARAREALAAFEANPDDPQFAEAARAAEEARRETERLDREHRRNVRDLSGTFGRVGVRRRPLTVGLASVCIAVFMAGDLSVAAKVWIYDHLLFFPLRALSHPHDFAGGLDAIRHGELWRLITPVFPHGGILHLAFNVWALLALGTLIETRWGTAKLLGLAVLSAVASNVGQYLYLINYDNQLTLWLGISGVVYGLFGYVWMKGQVDPGSGVMLSPATVQVMLLWLVLGFTGILELSGGPHPIRMANGAHLAGLVAGMLCGLARL